MFGHFELSALLCLGHLKKNMNSILKTCSVFVRRNKTIQRPKTAFKFYKHNLVAVCRTYVQFMKLLSASLFSQTAHRCLKRFL